MALQGLCLLFCLAVLYPLTSGVRQIIGSQPLYFVDDPEMEAHVINSTVILKKKPVTLGPVYYNNKKQDGIINNHHDAQYLSRPPIPFETIYNGIKGDQTSLKTKWSYLQSTTTISPNAVNENFQFEVINNHKSNKASLVRPQKPTSTVQVADSLPTQQTVVDVLGERVKHPDIIKSSAVKVLDAPPYLKTTIKHDKIIVAQKRTDKWQEILEEKPSNTVQSVGLKGSVAPVMDPWSNIPIPSQPSWASASKPVKGGNFPAQGDISAFPIKGGISASPVKGGNPIKGGTTQLASSQTMRYVLLPNWMI